MRRPKKTIENIVMEREAPTKQELQEAGLLTESGKRARITALEAKKPSIFDPAIHPYQAYCMCAQMGSTLDEIAVVFAVAKTTVESWLRKHPSFAQAIRDGRDAFNVGVIEKSLIKRATGYEYEEVTIKETLIKVGKDETTNEPIFKPIFETTRIRKQVAPDVNAIIFHLKNRASERWKDKTEQVSITRTDGNIKETLKNIPIDELKQMRDAMKKAMSKKAPEIVYNEESEEIA